MGSKASHFDVVIERVGAGTKTFRFLITAVMASSEIIACHFTVVAYGVIKELTQVAFSRLLVIRFAQKGVTGPVVQLPFILWHFSYPVFKFLEPVLPSLGLLYRCCTI